MAPVDDTPAPAGHQQAASRREASPRAVPAPGKRRLILVFVILWLILTVLPFLIAPVLARRGGAAARDAYLICAQGVVVGYVILVWLFDLAMRRLERRGGQREGR